MTSSLAANGNGGAVIVGSATAERFPSSVSGESVKAGIVVVTVTVCVLKQTHVVQLLLALCYGSAVDRLVYG